MSGDMTDDSTMEETFLVRVGIENVLSNART